MEEKIKIEVALTKERLATWFQELFDGADDILADVKDRDMSVWFKTKEEWETEMPIWERYAIFFMRSREMRVRFTEESEQGNVGGILTMNRLKAKLIELANKDFDEFARLFTDDSYYFDRSRFLMDCCIIDE